MYLLMAMAFRLTVKLTLRHDKEKYIKIVPNALEFFKVVGAVAGRLGIPEDWLTDVMYTESGLNPKARNPNSTATGLIQFMASTALGLGTTTGALYAMSNIAQMAFVEKYFRGHILRLGKPKTYFDLYCMVFYPAWVNKPDTALLDAKAYQANKQLDLNKNGQITKGEFRVWANNRVGRTTEKIVAGGGFIVALLLMLAAYKFGLPK